MMNRLVASGLFLALVSVAPLCRADIYAYTDAAGTTHFTNVPVDARYQLIVRTPPAGTALTGTQDARRAATWLARSPDYYAVSTRAAGAAKGGPEPVHVLSLGQSESKP